MPNALSIFTGLHRIEARHGLAPALLAATAGLLFLSSGASAADATNGSALARVWCSSCHVMPGAAPQTVPQGPPSFRMVAQSGKSAEQLRTFLMKPHGSMPNLTLSRGEIDDLIAYIGSIR